MKRLRYSLILLLAAGACFAQPVLRLKTRQIQNDVSRVVTRADPPAPFRPGHLLLQFAEAPSPATLTELENRGIRVLHGIPENGLLVTLDRPVSLDGTHAIYAEPLASQDKISPIVTANPTKWEGHFLVEFHEDVDAGDARAMLLRLRLKLQENPDLAPHQLMIQVENSREAVGAAMAAVGAQDEVSYIFPASRDLARGVPARAYASPLTTAGAVTQNIPTYGNGWAGPGHGAATVGYVFSTMTEQLPASETEAAIQKAMSQWSQAVQVTWAEGSSASAPQAVNIFFATYNHGDGYPFTGPGGVLAHTFYPAPPNPEPIAGDMHFNDSETWRIGSNTDVFSVALHEFGHALGLGHSDDPSDVMYPYYKMVSTLNSGDIAAVQTLYAPVTAAPVSPPAPNPAPPAPPAPAPPSPTPSPSPPPTPSPTPPPAPGGSKDTTPPALTIASPGGSTISTAATTITFLGTASDNVGVASVTWKTNTGGSGTATGTTSWAASVPLLVGSNTVTITATDTAGNTAWRSVVVSRQ